MSPQLYGYFLEQALAAGALDVTCSSAQMKKNRPGLTISILCEPDKSDALSQLLSNRPPPSACASMRRGGKCWSASR